MATVKFDQIEGVDLSNVRQILVMDEANKFHGPLEIWATRTMGALVGRETPSTVDGREQLLVEVKGEVTQEKLAAIVKALKAHETPPTEGGFLSIHEWERWGFEAKHYPK